MALLQVGQESKEVKIIVSTIAEIEHLFSTLCDLKSRGLSIDVLYGVPLPPSQVRRLAELSRLLGSGTITLLLDHPSQLDAVEQLHHLAQSPCPVFLKIDTGYHRAGLPPNALNKAGLLERVAQLEANGVVTLKGLYSHTSLSYAGTTPTQAMDFLASEINGCVRAFEQNRQYLSRNPELVISVGASPQVTSIQNLADSQDAADIEATKLRKALQDVSSLASAGFQAKLELHAGVYSVMDMQQLATQSRSSIGKEEDEIAIFVMAEVISVYNSGERQVPEALLAVGTLGLGREPCPSYSGWATVGSLPNLSENASQRRLIVSRISQEHSIISWETTTEDAVADLPDIPVQVGQSLRLYPNHACVTGAMYDWFLVVDSTAANPNEISDVWVRASGW